MDQTAAESAQKSSDSKTAGYQSWRQLGFLHWRIDPKALQQTLPAGLDIECFDGSAWLGLVPFSMENVRPWWFPPVPGISSFLETNLRTYVRHPSGLTGVWFYSLEASSRIGVWTARTFWNLPYHYSTMSLSETHGNDAGIRFACRRHGARDVGCEVELRYQEATTDITAAPGSLDEFLLERYTLFAPTASGDLRVGRVHHSPYTYRPVEVLRCEQSLTKPVVPELQLPQAPDHAVFSPGVDVRVSPLQLSE